VELGTESPIEFSVFNRRDAYLEVRVFGEVVTPRRRLVSAPFALKAEGEVPEGAVVMGEQAGDTAITGLGYTQLGDTAGRIICIGRTLFIQVRREYPSE
jgi:hypothetical protein